MKKKLVMLGIVCSIMLAAAGCKNGETAEEKKEEGGTAVSEYVTLGEYKGLSYTEMSLEVTDEELQEAIDEHRSAYATENQIMDRAVEDGDTANIDFVGYVDGEAFSGGTGSDYDLVIGSGSMIPGFEEGIIGTVPGNTVSVDVTFPEAYRPEGTSGSELNGKAAVFDITVNYIVEEILPEYNEQYVLDNTDYDTMEEFEQSLIDELIAERTENAENARLDELFGKLVENSEIHELPQSELDKYHDNMINSYQSMADSVGLELADFLLQYYGATEEQLESFADEYANTMATQAVIFQAIAKEENITVSDEEYQEGVEYYFGSMESAYESREAFEEEMGELIREALLYEKVEQFVVDNAVAVPAEKE